MSKSAGGPRIYRRADVERVLRIKQLVFADGLTLAGVRRRIDEEAPPVLEEADAAPIKELLGRNAKERLSEVKRGLMGILEMLNARPGDARVYAPPRRDSRRPRPRSARTVRVPPNPRALRSKETTPLEVDGPWAVGSGRRYGIGRPHAHRAHATSMQTID